MTRSKLWIRVALATVAVALLAAPIAAKQISCSISLKCGGADKFGCLDFSLGSRFSTKCYKDIKTGICSYIGTCKVWNKFERECSFKNQGCSIRDPESKKWLTCTSDFQLIEKCSKWNLKLKCWDRVSCSLSGCYNPCSSALE